MSLLFKISFLVSTFNLNRVITKHVLSIVITARSQTVIKPFLRFMFYPSLIHIVFIIILLINVFLSTSHTSIVKMGVWY